MVGPPAPSRQPGTPLTGPREGAAGAPPARRVAVPGAGWGTFAAAIQSDRETWLVDVAATIPSPTWGRTGASARTDGRSRERCAVPRRPHPPRRPGRPVVARPSAASSAPRSSGTTTTSTGRRRRSSWARCSSPTWAGPSASSRRSPPTPSGSWPARSAGPSPGTSATGWGARPSSSPPCSSWASPRPPSDCCRRTPRSAPGLRSCSCSAVCCRGSRRAGSGVGPSCWPSSTPPPAGAGCSGRSRRRGRPRAWCWPAAGSG